MCDTPETLYLVSKYSVVSVAIHQILMAKEIFQLIVWVANIFTCCSTNSKYIALVENKLNRSIKLVNKMPSLLNCTYCNE